jgi:competence protein ComEC
LVKVHILDVGQASCAVIVATDCVIVVDGGMKHTLLRFLDDNGIRHVNAIFLSHADSDHITGAVDLLLKTEIKVDRIYMNPHSMKDTDIMIELRSAVTDRVKKHETVPSGEEALIGAGAEVATDMTELSENDMSVVIRLVVDGTGKLMLTADMQDNGLSTLSSSSKDVSVEFLTFPHHGGKTGEDPIGFAKQLLSLTSPRGVIFSAGRGSGSNLIPEVVKSVRTYAPSAWIACTQLSEHCANPLPTVAATHLSGQTAHGRPDGHCCAGTITLVFEGKGLKTLPVTNDHQAFVSQFPDRLCK